jgi:TRAP-type C4-dicarboxylate transport system substrate-binding protein
LGIALAASTATARDVKVTIGTNAKHPVVANGWDPYVKAVERDTAGTLSFKLFLGGTLVSHRAAMNGVRDGVAEAGLMVLTYYPAEFPHANFIGDLALIGENVGVMAGAASEFYLLTCPECLREFEAQNIVFLGTYATSPFVLISKPKMTTLDELKGRKVRVAGANWSRWIQNFGGTGVALAANEMFEAMGSNVIDAAIQSPAALTSYSLMDTAKHVTMLPLGTAHATAPNGFSKTFWKTLTARERQVLVEQSAIMVAGPSIGYVEQDVVALKAAPGKGITVHQPSPELLAASKSFAAKDMDIVVGEYGSKHGIADAAAKAARFRALVEKWEKLAAPAGENSAALEALYRREIFQRISLGTFGM